MQTYGTDHKRDRSTNALSAFCPKSDETKRGVGMAVIFSDTHDGILKVHYRYSQYQSQVTSASRANLLCNGGKSFDGRPDKDY